MEDPWAQIELIINRALNGYQPDVPGAGRLWIESWHFGLRDPEMRADTLRDYGAWRGLIAGAVRRGVAARVFRCALSAEKVGVLAIALVDGMGIPVALGDPEIAGADAARDVLAVLGGILGCGLG
jgi:hypothetical protein